MGLRQFSRWLRPRLLSPRGSRRRVRPGVEALEPRLAPAGTSQAYNWQNVPIGGGGFVPGIVFSPTVPNLVYARTDVGGAYRWDQDIGRWTALTDFITYNDPAGMGVESLAIDPGDPDRVYAALGTYSQWWAGIGAILRSTDRGQTWQRTDVPFKMGGNEDGRSDGERLMVDPNDDSILFMGTRRSGLWKSTDYGATWNQVTGFPVTTTANGVGLLFVKFIKGSGTPGSATPTIYVGVSQTGSNLFRSTDGGATWQDVSNPALDPTQMPERAALDSDGSMYLTFGNAPGPNGMGNSNGTLDGSVWKLQTATGSWTNVTPPTNGQGGFSGVSVDAEHPGTLVVTTMDRWWPADDVYRSTNGGSTWTSLRNTDVTPWAWTDKIQWDLSSQPFVTSGGMGWPGDIEIDPFNANHVLVGTGGGIVGSFDLTDADSGAATHWGLFNTGLEETVHIAMISPASGAPLLTAAGDVGGYRFTDLNAPPQSSYGVMGGTNRAIDFAENNPNLVVRSGDASPYLVYSLDNGVSWTAFPSVPPGTNGSGPLALSADGSRLVWDPSGGTLSYATWNGSTWGNWTASSWAGSANVSPVSDRVNPNDFYVLDGTNLYASSNGGASWTLQTSSAPSGLLKTTFSAAGDLWVAASGNGLWHSTNYGATWTQVAGSVVTDAYQVGFGKAAPGHSYPAVYIAGSANGTTGLFRSDDGGATWVTITDAQHQWGGVGPIVGDRNTYGRVYVAAGARGVIFGDIQASAPTVVNAAAATLATGTTTNLSVLGADAGGEPNLTYTWRVTDKPPGAPAPTFSVNGTNAAQGTTVTFAQAGYYTFAVTLANAQGFFVTSFVGVTVKIGVFSGALDIGSPGAAGSSGYDPGTGIYTVAGSGGDIWNNYDQFQFLSESFSGDGTLLARVTGVQDTNTWAKAGVMFRDSTATDAMFADVVVTPSSGVSFQWRNSTGGYANYAPVWGVAAPAWVMLVRSGSSFSAFYATTKGTPAASDWVPIGTAQTILMSQAALAGLAVTSHADGTLCTATFSGVSVLPGGWGDGDVGSPGVPGYAGYDPATQTWTVGGGGGDIWNTSDQFHLASANLAGDGSLVARVTSVQDTDPWAKAGVMFRGDNTAGSAFADVVVTPGNGVAFQWRASAGSWPNSVDVPGISAPLWVKLTRVGNAFSGFYSADGLAWTQIGSAQSVTLNTVALAGLAVTAHNNGLLNNSSFADVSVTAAPATSFALTAPAGATAGGAVPLVLTAYNANGNVAAGYLGTVHFTSTDPGAALPADYTFTAADLGTHAFSATLFHAGTRTVAATDTANGGLTAGATVTVAPAAAAQLGFTAPPPATATAGSPFAVSVGIEDTYGNVVTSNSSGVALVVNGPGPLSGPTQVAAVNGVATFNGLTLTTSGGYTLTFTDGTLAGAATNLTVNPAAADHLAFQQQPTSSVAGHAITPAVTVRVLDPYNNLVTTSGVSVTLGVNTGPAGGTVSGTPTEAAVSGIATFPDAILTVAGNYTLTATAAGLGSATSAGLSVTAAALSQLALTAFASRTTAGVAHTFTVRATDAYGNTITGYRGTVRFASSDPLAVLPASYTFTGHDAGKHTFTATLKTAGSQSITATDTTNSSVTGSQTGILVTAAAASRLALTAPVRVKAGSPFGVTVTAYDAYGNVATSYLGTVRFTSSDGTATLPADYGFKRGDSGRHVFTRLVLRAQGKQTLTVTDLGDMALTISASILVV